MSDYTPGPWQVGSGRLGVVGHPLRRVVAGEDATLAGVFEEADARLIAAAPELYEALKAVEWVPFHPGEDERVCPSCGGWEPEHDEECSLVAVLREAVPQKEPAS